MGNCRGKAGRHVRGWQARVACCAVALAGAVPALAQNVSEEFDRIRGERTIAYTADGGMDLSRPVLTFQASFVGGASSMGIGLAFVSPGDGITRPASRFAACHDIAWMVDGQPLPAARASHRGNMVDGELIEQIDQDVTAQWVAALGNARNVRYRVCRNEYALTPGDINAFATITAKLRNAGHSSYVPAGATAPAPVQQVRYEGMNWRPRQGSPMPASN